MKANAREVLKVISRHEALNCILKRNSCVETRVFYQDGTADAYRTSSEALALILRNAEKNSGLICICDDAACPGFAIAAYNIRRERWERFKSDLSQVAKLEPSYRGRVAG